MRIPPPYIGTTDVCCVDKHTKQVSTNTHAIPAKAGIQRHFLEILVYHALIFFLLFIPSLLSAQVLGGSYRTLNGTSGGSLEFGFKPNVKLLATLQGQFFQDRWGAALTFTGGIRRVQVGVLAGIVSIAPDENSYAYSHYLRPKPNAEF